MDLVINSKIIIPSNEIEWRFSRSSGAGGQNINKTESRVEIVFDIQKSKILTPFHKSLILMHLKKYINHDCICLKVQKHRTQYENRKLAIAKLTTLLKDAMHDVRKKRKPTKPTKSSQRKRVEYKKKRGEVKRNRKDTQDYSP